MNLLIDPFENTISVLGLPQDRERRLVSVVREKNDFRWTVDGEEMPEDSILFKYGENVIISKKALLEMVVFADKIWSYETIIDAETPRDNTLK